MKNNLKYLASLIMFFSFPVLSNEWQPIATSLDGNNIAKIEIDNSDSNNLFSITYNGEFYISNDKANSWVQIQSSAEIRDVAFIPGTPSKIIASVNDGYYRLYDFNELLDKKDWTSWFELSVSNVPVNTDCDFVSIAFDTYCLSNSNNSDNIWKLYDLGNTWQTLLLPSVRSEPIDKRFTRDANEGIYLLTWDGLYKTANGGSNWLKTKMKGLKHDRADVFIKADSSVNDLLFLYSETYSPNTVDLYKSVNGGDSWKKVYRDIMVEDILINKNNGIIYVASDKGISKSTNHGDRWSNNKSYGRAKSLAIDPNNSARLYAGTDQGVVVSEDSGNTWRLSSAGIRNNIVSYICDIENENICYMSTQNGRNEPFTQYKSIDQGISWSKFNFKGKYIGLAYIKGGNLIGESMDGEALISNNSGKTWKALWPKSRGVLRNYFVDNSNNIYIISYKLKNYKYRDHEYEIWNYENSPLYSLNISTNFGKSWQTLTPFKPNSYPMQDFELPSKGTEGVFGMDLSSPNKIYFCTNIVVPDFQNGRTTFKLRVKLLVSNNVGKNWAEIQAPTVSNYCSKLAYDSKTDTLLYLDEGLHELFKLTDNGTKWISIYQERSIKDIIFDSTNSSIYLRIIGKGIKQSNDGGLSWSEVNSGLPSLKANFLSTIIYQGKPNIITSTEGAGLVYRLD